MHSQESRKQISIFLAVNDWRRLRDEAARQRVPITELCRQWLRPGLNRLRDRETPIAELMPESNPWPSTTIDSASRSSPSATLLQVRGSRLNPTPRTQARTG